MTEVESAAGTETPEGLQRPWALSLTLDGPQGLYETLPLPALGTTQTPTVLPTVQVALKDLSGQLTPEHAVYLRADFGLLQGPFYADLEGTLILKNHKLKLVGQHQMHLWIEASDENGHKKVVHQQDFNFWVDPYAPTLTLEEADELLYIRAEDIGTPVEKIEMRWRSLEQPWSSWMLLQPLALVDLNACEVQVQLRDLAGNLSQQEQISLCEAVSEQSGFTYEEKSTRQAELQTSYGCQQSTTSFYSWTGMLAGLLMLRRRRRKNGRASIDAHLMANKDDNSNGPLC